MCCIVSVLVLVSLSISSFPFSIHSTTNIVECDPPMWICAIAIKMFVWAIVAVWPCGLVG